MDLYISAFLGPCTHPIWTKKSRGWTFPNNSTPKNGDEKWLTCLIYGICRQERFIRRWVDALSDPRVTHEIRSIWISYWSQVSLTPLKLSHTYFCRLYKSLFTMPDFRIIIFSSCIPQADRSLGMKLENKLNVRPTM